MRVTSIEASAYRIPTDRPEADGTFCWDSTTMVLVEVTSDSGETGLGFSYTSAAAVTLIASDLEGSVVGADVEENLKTWESMVRAVRNIGRPGLAASAIAALDTALWDLKAKAQGLPLFVLLGVRRREVPIYGSGGFTTYSEQELADQLGGWVAQGIPRVKMKIGTDWGARPEDDVHRVAVAREAIGPDAQLFVDANGAYSAKQAIGLAERFAEYGVSYFEEPVSSDHLEEMAFVRKHAPMDIAAGEYGYDPYYFRRLLDSGAVDILQADATRCLGITGFLRAADLAYGAGVPFSAHTSPSIHAHAACAAPQISHVEYFHDHARIESMLFDGVLKPVGGCLRPDTSRPGLGLQLRRGEAEKWRVS